MITIKIVVSIEDYMLPCLTKQLLGFECLGCGSQRALSLLIHGEFISAFKMYPAIYTLIPLFLVIGATTQYLQLTWLHFFLLGFVHKMQL